MFNKSCRWLDSNLGPLVLEATALPTAPQPLPEVAKIIRLVLFPHWNVENLSVVEQEPETEFAVTLLRLTPLPG